MNLVCIKCPRGCNLQIENNSISGNMCPRGIDYAKEELTCPQRIVTALIKVGNCVAPVKTDKEVPKDKIKLVLDAISKINLKSAKIGDIVIKNVVGLDANVVVTGNIYNFI